MGTPPDTEHDVESAGQAPAPLHKRQETEKRRHRHRHRHRHRLGKPTQRARDLRNHGTEAEKRLWFRLRKSQLAGLKFSRQMPLAGYIVDFVCREHKLIVELNGSQHAEAEDYDRTRTRRLEEIGFRVVQFWNNDLTSNMDGVLETILAECQRLQHREAAEPIASPFACGSRPRGGHPAGEEASRRERQPTPDPSRKREGRTP